MRILDKYIVKNFLIPFFYCLFLFIFLYIIIDLFGHLDEILKNKIPVLMLQEYYLSLIPFILMSTTPVAALISTIYVISSMNKYDEITAMRAAGINIFRVMAPFICIGLAISIVIFAISEKLLPASVKNAQAIKELYIEKESLASEKENTSQVKKMLVNNIALYGKDDKLIFVKTYDRAEGLASHITILKQDKNGNVIKKINAQEGKWADQSWAFYNVLVYELDEDGMIKGNPLFLQAMDFDMEDPGELISKGTNYEFMSFKDLSNYIDNFSNTSPDIINRLRVDLHQKVSFPFTSLVVILIGAGFAIKIRRRGKTAAIMGMGMSILIGFIYYALMAACLALGKGGILPPFISAHCANVIFSFVGIALIRN